MASQVEPVNALAPALPVRQHLPRGQCSPRHRHAGAYVALVLAGGYREAGDSGRRWVEAGDVILHAPFEAHANRIGERGATVLNLVIDLPTPSAFMTVSDPDAVARLAERDAEAACACLTEQLRPSPMQAGDWRDALAADLRASPDLLLTDWANAARLDPATVSRGFREAFGVTPARYRAEARARRAWSRLAEDTPLAELAADAGFADQAHMTRAIVTLTGLTPGVWRRSNRFKTENDLAA